jgi:DUF971 family protein
LNVCNPYHSVIILFLQKFDIFMSGLTPNSPRPIDIKLHQASRLLEIKFDNNMECMLSCEFLRVYSPSAEVKGHGPGQEVLQIGKEDINITAIEPVGNYAVRLVFSDGHNTGLYSWDYLYDLASNYEGLWLEYLGKLSAAGHVRKNTA